MKRVAPNIVKKIELVNGMMLAVVVGFQHDEKNGKLGFTFHIFYDNPIWK